MIKVTCKQHKANESTFNEAKLEQMVNETAFGRSSGGTAGAIAGGNGGTSTGGGSGSCAGGAAGV
ncbi:hypothetical protein CW749_08595 [Vibrio sp. vnigr-6D03]|uniref:Bacteriocin n=1 Tax=Vibrio penaeicida TaxID=104609 RepID=A0AAV5P041_9VIBR|nr:MULTISPECIES: hypothetical protein [Vibrio]PKF79753.1 hypothetical protein CW749_08595 [Vibrio sp. vnigr-6D03]GLQ75929.1 hypothetical protein GCM10007932_52920 [Vibrio penaeicida]